MPDFYFDHVEADAVAAGTEVIKLESVDAAEHLALRAAHEAAVEEKVVLVGLEVADVVGIKPATCGAALDLSFEIHLVPDVIDVEGDANIGQGELGAEVVGVAQGADGRAVAGIDGVQGFDEELHPGVAGSGSDSRNAFGDLGAVGLWGLADGGAADEHELVDAEGLALAQGGEVVVDGFVACFSGEAGEEAAANEGDGFQLGVGEVLAGGFEITISKGFPPDGDAANTFAGIMLDALGEVPRFGGVGMDGEA